MKFGRFDEHARILQESTRNTPLFFGHCRRIDDRGCPRCSERLSLTMRLQSSTGSVAAYADALQPTSLCRNKKKSQPEGWHSCPLGWNRLLG